MVEIWDLVDKDGRRTGVKCARSDRDKIPSGSYHPCVEIWVTAGERLLITKRHPDKSEGLKYDVPDGAVLSGESIIDGAVRELYEEVGILTDSHSLEHLGSISVGKVYAASYILRLDALPEIKLQPSEVVKYRLVTVDELEKMTDLLTDGTHRRYISYKNRIFKQ